MHYVYIIECSLSDKFYIGYTNNYKFRWASHKHSGRHKGRSKLYSHMRKYGTDNYEMILVERFEHKQDALQYEVDLISKSDPNLLLNLAPGGEGGYSIPLEKRPEWRKKLSESRQGRKPSLGMKHSDENKKLFSECAKKRWEGKTYPLEVLDHSFLEANRLFGISKTHYYRLLKQAKSSDLS